MERRKTSEIIASVSLTALGLYFISLLAFSKEQRRSWFMKEFKATCQDCGRKWDEGFMLEYDHKIPVSKGGPDTLDNANLVCQECHAKKHHDDGEYYAERLILARMIADGRNWHWIRENSKIAAD